MSNIEGIRISEVPEQNIEKNSMSIDENKSTVDFSDCKKTPEDKKKELQSLKEELMYFNSCVKTGQTEVIEDDFEDCQKK